MKKKTILMIIGILLLILGVCVFLYPSFSKWQTERKQKALMEDLKQEILANANKNSDKNTGSSDDSDKMEQEDIDLSGLELEDNENAKEIDSSTKTEFEDAQVEGIIEIEKINIMFAIVEGASRANLSYSICHITGTDYPGEKGNCVLAGHRGGIHGKFFKYLNKMEAGDKVEITDISGKVYTYEVFESFVCEPTDTYICNDVEGHEKMLTMVTCENSGTQRLVVRADLVE